jgi:SAM-dependent methyltransferase
MRTNFDSAKAFVNRKRLDGHESLSGPGSHIANTKECVDFINKILKEKNIQSILDLGCGDWNWFKNIELVSCTYEGWDACEIMIQDNKKFYGCSRVNFEVKDIVTEDYPFTDLIICRDVLFHMAPELALKIIEQAKNKCKYFLSTSFNNVETNTGIGKVNWGFYRINLNISPFDLEKYLVEFVEESRNKQAGYSRMVNLYAFNT